MKKYQMCNSCVFIFFVCSFDRINSISMCQRTADEVKKKWIDTKSSAKKKAQSMKKELGRTGGGPYPGGLTNLEEKVVTVIPKCSIDGIVNAIDIFADAQEGDVPSISYSISEPVQGASCPAREVSNEPETERKASVSEKIKKRQKMEDVSASSQRDMIVKLEEEKVFLLKELICAHREQTAHLQQLTASVNKLTDAMISNNVMSSFFN
ncbi:uncharacterized protein LOC127868215 isoform X1 [Dreissena polymorpha]|nr:uncharacterized protein LOC127868215 isoform X1 [Dreissena polymorpha]